MYKIFILNKIYILNLVTLKIVYIKEVVESMTNPIKFSHVTSFFHMLVIAVKGTSWNKPQKKVIDITAKIFAVYPIRK